MTESAPTNPAAKKPVTKEQLQLARCAFLDSFADTEIALGRLAKRLALKGCGLTVGQRLEALKTIKASPSFSQAKVQKLAEQLTRLQSLNAIRADVVHSRLAVAPIGGQARACFINSTTCSDEAPTARLVTRDEFAKFSKVLKEIAVAVDGL